MTAGKVASVALLQSLGRPLDYSIDERATPLRIGALVEVPLRSSTARGIVVDIKKSTEFASLKPIGRTIEPSALTAQLMQLAQWMAAYYCCRLDQILKCTIPSHVREERHERLPLVLMRKKTVAILRSWCQEHRAKVPKQAAIIDCLLITSKGILVSEVLKRAGVTRSPLNALVEKGLVEVKYLPQSELFATEHEYFTSKAKTLSSEQAAALSQLSLSIDEQKFCVHLLHGVTGSGKTEVYLQAITRVLNRGKKVLILVPEISLTPQTVERFKSRFTQKLAVIHSKIPPNQRSKLWREMTSGSIDVVIGARSAVFCPLHPLGLIIVDEEHEASYKSEQLPYYHARDVLEQRAKIEKAVLLLASATPSMESYQKAVSGESSLLELHTRAADAKLPELKLVNMSTDAEKVGVPLLSKELLSALEGCRSRGEQGLLFLNRRGYRSSLICLSCQMSVQCPDCDVSLTYHLEGKALCCHFCGKTTGLPKCCPHCHHEELTFRGWGTQHVEQGLKRCLPGLRVLRVDRDTTEGEGALEKMLHAFSTGKADVLIGTQMIGKGHHFPAVTLAGILNPDHGLHIPDFRASERLFQTLLQVAGRSGRSSLPGKVLIQTHHPEHELFTLALKGDYKTFFKQEIEIRKNFHYPPSLHLIKCLMKGDEPIALQRAIEVYHQLVADVLPPQVLISPPMPSPRARLQTAFRFQFIIKTARVLPVTRRLAAAAAKQKLSSSHALYIDVDPLTLS